jgi:hypothetical protein
MTTNPGYPPRLALRALALPPPHPASTCRYLYAKQAAVEPSGATSTVLQSQMEVSGRLHLRHTNIDEATLKKMQMRSLHGLTAGKR